MEKMQHEKKVKKHIFNEPRLEAIYRLAQERDIFRNVKKDW